MGSESSDLYRRSYYMLLRRKSYQTAYAASSEFCPVPPQTEHVTGVVPFFCAASTTATASLPYDKLSHLYRHRTPPLQRLSPHIPEYPALFRPISACILCTAAKSTAKKRLKNISNIKAAESAAIAAAISCAAIAPGRHPHGRTGHTLRVFPYPLKRRMPR